jgi:hypothetical protein
VYGRITEVEENTPYRKERWIATTDHFLGHAKVGATTKSLVVTNDIDLLFYDKYH